MKNIKNIIGTIILLGISCNNSENHFKEKYFFNLSSVYNQDIRIKHYESLKFNVLEIGKLTDKKEFSYFIQAFDYNGDNQFDKISFETNKDSLRQLLNVKTLNFIYNKLENQEPDSQVVSDIFPRTL